MLQSMGHEVGHDLVTKATTTTNVISIIEERNYEVHSHLTQVDNSTLK